MHGHNLTLSYNSTAVVHGAEIQLQPGQVTALVGPNGSGKSTLLRALARLHRVDSGSVSLGERLDCAAGPSRPNNSNSNSTSDSDAGSCSNAFDLSSREFACRVTLLAQSRPTPSGLSVREVVEFGRHPHRARFTRRDEGGTIAVAHAMRVTGIADLANRPVDALSGGQLQRVWLASCLAQDTEVLLLDEPTSYLDLRYQVELLDLIRELADIHSVTVGVVLHDLDQAAAIADHIVLLESGRVRASGTPHEVLRSDTLSAAYGIRVEVDHDETGAIRTRAIGRYSRHHGGAAAARPKKQMAAA